MGQLIAAAAYNGGRRVADISIEEGRRWAQKPDYFVWIGFHEPNESELREIQVQFELHPLAIEDALHAHQRPKLELYGDSLFLVLRTAQLQGDHVAFGETHIFAGQGFVISIRHGPSASYAPVRARCESCPRLLRHGEDYVLYAILDFVVDNYLPVIEAMESEVAELEDRVLKDRIARGDVERIYQLRRELLQLRRTVAPTIEVCRRLEHLELPIIDDPLRHYFRDVVDHVQRVNESIDVLREVLTFSFEAGLLLQSARQGDVQKRFAGWAAILAVPTAIAGIYGMNFNFMPELNVRFGYFAVLAVILAICLYLFYRFRKRPPTSRSGVTAPWLDQAGQLWLWSVTCDAGRCGSRPSPSRTWL